MNETELDDLLRQGKLKMLVLNNQIWVETISRARTVRGLRAFYWDLVKEGRAVGYQFVTVHEHHLGRPSKPYR